MSQPLQKSDLLLTDVRNFYRTWGTLGLYGDHKPPSEAVASEDIKQEFLLKLGLGSGALGVIVETDRRQRDGAAITSEMSPGFQNVKLGKFLGDIGVRYVLTNPANHSDPTNTELNHAWQKRYGLYDDNGQLSVVTDEIISMESLLGPRPFHQLTEHPHVSDQELSALFNLVDLHRVSPQI